MGYHARAARLRVRDELRPGAYEDEHLADHVLGLRGHDGPVALDRLPAIFGHFDRAGVLRHCRGLCGAEPLRLHDQERSEEHTSELQSLMRSSYAVFCLKKKQRHLNKTEIQIRTMKTT